MKAKDVNWELLLVISLVGVEAAILLPSCGLSAFAFTRIQPKRKHVCPPVSGEFGKPVSHDASTSLREDSPSCFGSWSVPGKRMFQSATVLVNHPDLTANVVFLLHFRSWGLRIFYPPSFTLESSHWPTVIHPWEMMWLEMAKCWGLFGTFQH